MSYVKSFLSALLNVYENEPAVVVGALDAVALLAQALGAPIDPNSQKALDAALIAISVLLVRSKVVPTAKLV